MFELFSYKKICTKLSIKSFESERPAIIPEKIMMHAS